MQIGPFLYNLHKPIDLSISISHPRKRGKTQSRDVKKSLEGANKKYANHLYML